MVLLKNKTFTGAHLESLVERVHPHPLPLIALQPPQVSLSG